MEIRGNELGAPQLKGEPARRVLLLSVNGSNFKKRMSKEINDVCWYTSFVHRKVSTGIRAIEICKIKVRRMSDLRGK